jgi:hypothetical protein
MFCRTLGHGGILAGSACILSGTELSRPAMPADPRTVLVIGQQVLARAPAFDTASFLRFLQEGGRSVILEQNDLEPTGLGLKLVDHESTMSFPLCPAHRIFRGLGPDSLKWWGRDMFVARKQIQRSGSGGLRALAVTGGPACVSQAPLALRSVGRGCVVFVQALAGEKTPEDPAASDLICNAVAAAAEEPEPRLGKVLVLGSNVRYVAGLRSIGLDLVSLDRPLSGSDLEQAAGIVVCGGGKAVTESAEPLRKAAEAGIPIVLHRPTPEAFETLKKGLLAQAVRAREASNDASLGDRSARLMDGVAREDLCLTTTPTGWDHRSSYRVGTVRCTLEPIDSGSEQVLVAKADGLTVERGERSGGAAHFDRRGIVRAGFSMAEAGAYPVSILSQCRSIRGEAPVLEIRVDGEVVDRLEAPGRKATIETLIQLQPGRHEIEAECVNGPEWGGGSLLDIYEIRVGARKAFPKGWDLLVMPAAVVSWRANRSTVVFDGFDWEDDPDNRLKGATFAGALMANLGLPFVVPAAAAASGR